MANTPPPGPVSKLPPRSSAAGPTVVDAPARQLKSPVPPKISPTHAVAIGTQSATHSDRFPTMSNPPQRDTQLARDPVVPGSVTGTPSWVMLQSVLPLSVPGSGVPAAAPCHSAL